MVTPWAWHPAGGFPLARYAATLPMTGAPKDLRQQIDKMFVISVSITQNAAPGAKPEDKVVGKPILKRIECEAPLLGTGYAVKHP
jgi:hypothetical protein